MRRVQSRKAFPVKTKATIANLSLLSATLLAGTPPYFTTHPASVTVAPGATATLTVQSTNATSYQWRFNGTDILNATNSTLSVVNAQNANNTGYYMAIAKNSTGWTPSQLAWLSVVGTVGVVPFSNTNN